KPVPTIAALQILGRENRLQYRRPFVASRIDRSGVDIGDTPNSAGFCGRIRMLHPNSDTGMEPPLSTQSPQEARRAVPPCSRSATCLAKESSNDYAPTIFDSGSSLDRT